MNDYKMYNFKIRFNTECPNKESENALCWRVLINNKEELASSIEINVPTRAISHILANGVRKWSIECEAACYSNENGKLIIHAADPKIQNHDRPGDKPKE